ncbi:MAG TPA: LysR family transcriptional regulator [Cellvibrionaceae bacterium]|nr:LysR family transcriptional regulator [Cellvibrionaceae bacterium]HNG58551.1 LysR family transcriptional regulator [Cellvibrionaceae bacterium]
MTLNELRFFIALAKTQHFGKAAALCHVSQPNLSMGIKKLEAALGLELFERSKLGVRLLPQAEPLLQCAQAALGQVQTLKDLAQQMGDHLHGPLKLGVQQGLAPEWLPQVLGHLKWLAPHMPLVLQEAEAGALVANLRTGEIDTLLNCQLIEAPDTVSLKLADETYVALLPAQHPFHTATCLSLDEIAERLQIPAADSALVMSLQQLGLRSITLATVGIELLKQVTAADLAVTLLPKSSAQAAVAQNQFLAWLPVNPAPQRPLYLHWRSNFPRHKAIDALKRALITSCSVFWDFTHWQEQDEPYSLADHSRW